MPRSAPNLRDMAWIGRATRWALGGWLAWRIFGPEVPISGPGVQTRPIHIPGRTVFVGDREFFVREAGPEGAPVVVLLHGWSFDGEMTFFGVIPDLATRYRVVVPDHRGHGRSDWIREPYDIADVARDVAGVLDALSVEGALVFGYSMGGLVAQELARARPDLVDRLMLAATAAAPAVRHRGIFRVALVLGRGLTRIARKEFSAVSTGVLRRAAAIAPEHTRWMWEGLMRRDATLYYYAGDSVTRFDSRPWVAGLGIPTMVVIPGGDQLMPLEAQRELAALFPPESVVEIEGGRHESIMNRAAEYVKLISDFREANG